MIEPLRHRAVVMLECRYQPWLNVHGGAQLDGRAARVRHMQGPPLMSNLDPCRRQSRVIEEGLGFVEVLLGEDAHAHTLRLRLRTCLLEHEAVMTGLGDASQENRLRVLVADDETEKID